MRSSHAVRRPARAAPSTSQGWTATSSISPGPTPQTSQAYRYEAVAFGKAVVVTNTGGFAEIAAAGAARMVAPEDPDALGAALSALVTDPPARERLGAAALAARGRYSWDAAARATLALYERMTSCAV